MTLTFSENLTDRAEAQKRFNSFATHFLRHQVTDYIAAVERQARGAIHYHLIVAFPYDIRTGFDIERYRKASAAAKRGQQVRFRELAQRCYRTAPEALRAWWRTLREAAERYRFGRCETLPVLANAEAVARYVGSYVISESNLRKSEDKGLRTLRYGLRFRACASRWSFAKGAADVWRRGCEILGQVLVLPNVESFTENLGPRWAFYWRKEIFAFGLNFTKLLPLLREISDHCDFTNRLCIATRMAAVCMNHPESVRAL